MLHVTRKINLCVRLCIFVLGYLSRCLRWLGPVRASTHVGRSKKKTITSHFGGRWRIRLKFGVHMSQNGWFHIKYNSIFVGVRTLELSRAPEFTIEVRPELSIFRFRSVHIQFTHLQLGSCFDWANYTRLIQLDLIQTLLVPPFHQHLRIIRGPTDALI